MRILFLGTPDFAVPTLKRIYESEHEIVAVVTAPPKPSGRGLKTAETSVGAFAVQHNLLLLRPQKLRDPEFTKHISALKPELGIVVAFRMLPKEVWALPTFGTLNLHASLLPNYRGAAPINWAIMNGEHTTGITTFFLNEQIDTGSILMQESVEILPQENAGKLHDRLMNLGAELVLETVRRVASGSYTAVLQNESHTPRTAPKLNKTDLPIEWNRDVFQIYNQIRGLSPYPGASTQLDGKSIKVFDAFPESSKAAIFKTAVPGSFISDGKTYLRAFAGGGWLNLLELQMEGKRRMTVDEFLRGFKSSGDIQYV